MGRRSSGEQVRRAASGVLAKAFITNKHAIIDEEADCAVATNSKQSHEGCAHWAKYVFEQKIDPNQGRWNGAKKKPQKGYISGPAGPNFAGYQACERGL